MAHMSRTSKKRRKLIRKDKPEKVIDVGHIWGQPCKVRHHSTFDEKSEKLAQLLVPE